MSELVGRVMGSELQLIAVGGPQDVVRRIAGFLDQLEQHWSRFLPDSDITHINLADGAWVTVAPETLTLLATMQAGVELTAGRYDPTMLPRLVELGYDASRHDPTKRTLLPAPAPRRGDLWDIEFDTEHSAVRVPVGSCSMPAASERVSPAISPCVEPSNSERTDSCARSAATCRWVARLPTPRAGRSRSSSRTGSARSAASPCRAGAWPPRAPCLAGGSWTGPLDITSWTVDR
ncbi:MAG: FAD:protein FMN transferase [Ilumatobacteraceae bacterium]